MRNRCFYMHSSRAKARTARAQAILGEFSRKTEPFAISAGFWRNRGENGHILPTFFRGYCRCPGLVEEIKKLIKFTSNLSGLPGGESENANMYTSFLGFETSKDIVCSYTHFPEGR
jgi:hypothetical protein